ncbi:hypothetical protein [Acidipropionibacterium jensenii]|uniref:hypothetical protein n=1 Tax=Acidipropionibacterium jensenii TaxID=1749 RepID=UPI0018D59AF6|nr:hypothetical protein [Acidipropionibacterium jensenii]MDN5995409.1 hypothetical protein [Acidipropionibacterium jensenii]MDN6441140.1 hypothetical protein [Acidipropionibacterium jensenii]MDN6760894.1 hypothetical protein [Acidipropionibacterium jensenii]
MDVAAFVISCLSLVVAGLGTWLANARAKEALEESRRAAADACWSKLQEAVQRLVGFDPAAEPINDRLTNPRIAMMELVEKLGDEWKGLDLWLDSERTLGATFGRLVMEQARPDDSIDRRLKSLNLSCPGRRCSAKTSATSGQRVMTARSSASSPSTSRA